MLLRVDTGQDGNDGELVDALKNASINEEVSYQFYDWEIIFLITKQINFYTKVIFYHLSQLSQKY